MKTHSVEPYLGTMTRFKFHDRDHVPDTKRRGEIESSIAIATIIKHPRAGWVSIRLEEITTSHSGRVAGRSISVTLPDDVAEVLRAYLNT